MAKRGLPHNYTEAAFIICVWEEAVNWLHFSQLQVYVRYTFYRSCGHLQPFSLLVLFSLAPNFTTPRKENDKFSSCLYPWSEAS